MARYIDADKYVEYLEKKICSKCIDEVCGACWLDGAIWIAEEFPTEDVVPRAEVAREIFEEIMYEIKQRCLKVEILADEGENEEYYTGCADAYCRLGGYIIELKKKYIGGSENEN